MLEVHDLCVSFGTNGQRREAVSGASWSLRRERTLALVGESGCGKSVTALAILRLLPQPPARVERGVVHWRAAPGAAPVNLLDLPERALRPLRGGQLAMIFQEPMTSLNPVYSIGAQLMEAARLHLPVSRRTASDMARQLLTKVQLPEPDHALRAYPHQLSGGMLQRVMIAMALICRPAVVIADEPTTALDVTTQAGVLDLLARLQRETGMSLVIITHDFGVVARAADDCCVMYAGHVVERGPSAHLLHHPRHPYTQALLHCLPASGTGTSASMPSRARFPTSPYRGHAARFIRVVRWLRNAAAKPCPMNHLGDHTFAKSPPATSSPAGRSDHARRARPCVQPKQCYQAPPAPHGPPRRTYAAVVLCSTAAEGRRPVHPAPPAHSNRRDLWFAQRPRTKRPPRGTWSRGGRS